LGKDNGGWNCYSLHRGFKQGFDIRLIVPSGSWNSFEWELSGIRVGLEWNQGLYKVSIMSLKGWYFLMEKGEMQVIWLMENKG
jgi:hypothetical protein